MRKAINQFLWLFLAENHKASPSHTRDQANIEYAKTGLIDGTI